MAIQWARRRELLTVLQTVLLTAAAEVETAAAEVVMEVVALVAVWVVAVWVVE